MRVDLHVHTWYSYDAISSPSAVLKAARRKKIGALAITDHNRLTPVRSDSILVIPGEEVRTTHGDIIGLGISDEIPPGLSPLETIDRIREQGGVVVVPHPFDPSRRSSSLLLNYDGDLPKDVVVEVLNARYLSWKPYELAVAFAIREGRATVAGSDAHSAGEVGRAYTYMHFCDDIECVLRRIVKGDTVPKGSLLPRIRRFSSVLGRLAHAVRIMPL